MLGLCVLALAWPACHSVIGLGTGFMYLAPALVLVFPLLAGRYLGERRLLDLARRIPDSRRSGHLDDERPRPVFAPLLARGGRLIAASLAVRPPPLLATR